MTLLSRRGLIGAAAGATALIGLAAIPAAADGHGTGKTFVLIHGSWFGGWVWNDVAVILRAAGHEVHAPTLTGLSNRAHVMQDSADLSTHITDITAYIDSNDLRNVHLVGWSYGGMVATGVIAEMGDRIADLTYLDAFVPQPGQSIVDIFGPVGEQLYGANRDNDQVIPPIPLEMLGVTDAAFAETILPRLTPQPWRTYFEAATVPAQPPQVRTRYVLFRWENTPFEPFYQFAQSVPFIEAVEFEGSHLAMLEQPEDVANILMQ
ncbi:alpha/beta fold hydrolase [Pseudaestuariivita rosea]|uniref:alpha/beta fold hydrolase n=1 Tax=Pseudaestuariivita rosea TaxID=2763263 RepID=UPI001ABB688F|nr:alpha/beta hydrolase [Pseudaestuariivita rosea]